MELLSSRCRSRLEILGSMLCQSTRHSALHRPPSPDNQPRSVWRPTVIRRILEAVRALRGYLESVSAVERNKGLFLHLRADTRLAFHFVRLDKHTGKHQTRPNRVKPKGVC